MVANMLCIIQRGWLDCASDIYFLCTRVRDPDMEDWKKLNLLISFLAQTIDDEWIIGADSLSFMKTFICSSHAVHEYMKCHIGGVTVFGTGVLNEKLSKQKMNSQRSRETEVIGNSEYLPYSLWFQYFMKSQSYTLQSNQLWQDNEGAQKMAENGKILCSSKSRHIAINFFG